MLTLLITLSNNETIECNDFEFSNLADFNSFFAPNVITNLTFEGEDESENELADFLNARCNKGQMTEEVFWLFHYIANNLDETETTAFLIYIQNLGTEKETIQKFEENFFGMFDDIYSFASWYLEKYNVDLEEEELTYDTILEVLKSVFWCEGNYYFKR